MIPETVSHYRILSKLGAGGMGEVYLAEDLDLGRQVALKLLPAKFTQDKERVRRFEQEARAASRLSHPNILTIYEIGEAQGTYFMAAEYVDAADGHLDVHAECLYADDAGAQYAFRVEQRGRLLASGRAAVIHSGS